VGTEKLVDAEVRFGQEVVEALDRAEVPYRAALWYFAPQYDEWRLLIATPLVNEEGSPKAYLRILKVLSKEPASNELPFTRVWLVKDDDPLIDAIAKSLHLRRGTKPKFTGGSLQGSFARDAHIYRLQA
jgi:hypothetical protein